MIPLSLQIQGLYSYQEKQSIDFSRMIEAELFGIFGATGSGKSSILDAIFLSLYGKCERLKGNIAGGTNYNLMNLKSNKLFLDFEFLDGEGQKYKFTLETSRSKKNFDSIKPLQRKFFAWKENRWIPLENPNVDDIVGLNYDNFRRTIIIPQGKFQEFIHLKSTDRERMLIDIFGLHKFDLSDSTKSLLFRNQQNIDKTEVLLHQYDEVTEEFIAAKKEEKQDLIAQQFQLEKEIAQVRVALNQAETLKGLFQRKIQLSSQLASLLEQKDNFEEKQRRLDQYVLCLDKFSRQLTEHQNFNQQLQQISQNLEAQAESLNTSEEELQSKKQAFVKIEEVFQNRDSLKNKAEEYDELIELLDIHTNISGKAHRLEEARKYLDELNQKLSRLEGEQKSLQKTKDDLRQGQVDEGELRSVERWFHEKERLDQENEFIRKGQDKVDQSIQEAKERKKQILNKTSLDPRQRELSVQVIIKLLEQQQENLNQRGKELQSEIRQLQLSTELFQLSKSLEEGEDCPVCGSSHHPNLFHNQELRVDSRKAERELNGIENQQQILNEALPQLKFLLDQSKSIQKEVQEIKASREQLSQKIDQHRTHFVWKNYAEDKPELIKEAIEKREVQKSEVEKIEQRLKSLSETQKEHLSKKELYTGQAEHIRNQLSSLEGQFEAGIKKLKYLNFDQEKNKGADQLLHEKRLRLDEYTGIGNTHEQFRSKILEQEKKINILKGNIEAEKRNQSNVLKALAKLNSTLENKIALEGFGSIKEVSIILAQTINIDSERENIRNYQQSLTECQTSLKDIEEDIGGRKFDEESFLLQKKKELDLEERLKHIRQNTGVLTEIISQLEQKLIVKKDLQKKLEGLNHRRSNLRTLEGLFKGKGFVKYVSTMHLENLCVAANQRFTMLTNNSLTLEVDSQNNFYVRDLLNEGRRRSIKTLSGGQTFQAALCLALALSDQVQKQVKAKQNFFFLDEGFGSQDKNSLQVIFQTLKSLRKENRIVGVISHVEELQMEIDNHLKIELDQDKGSQVYKSWI